MCITYEISQSKTKQSNFTVKEKLKVKIHHKAHNTKQVKESVTQMYLQIGIFTFR